MRLELVRTRTADGVSLEGLWYTPAAGGVPPMPSVPSSSAATPGAAVKTWLLVHGAGGRCTASGVLEEFAHAVVAQGSSVLRIDTRGHDFVASLSRGRWGGAAWERIEECTLDLAAWQTWLAPRAEGPVGWLGHSLGGVKALWALAHEPEAFAGVSAVVAAAPPRFHHASFLAHPDGPAFRDEYTRACDLAELGSGRMLLETTQPVRSWISAEGFVEKYGPSDRYDFVAWLAAVRPPTLALIPETAVRRSMASYRTPEALAALAARKPNLAWRIVPEADVNFTGGTETVDSLVRRWDGV